MTTLQDLLDLPDPVQEKDPRNWNKPSLAVIASYGEDGVVLWAVGPHLESEMEENGLHLLSELGLDDAPVGISIWEGKYEWQPGGYECPEDGTSYPSGTFRAPTAGEWISIQKNECPWDEADWLHTETDGVK